MKSRFILLSLAIVAAGQALPANAQEGAGGDRPLAQEGGMRWNYRPNVWGAKKASKPQPVAYVPHSVSPGAMVHASDYLGIDPSKLKRPAPPPPTVQQQVQAIVSVPHTQAAPFEREFGAPMSEHKAPSKSMTESPSPAAKSMTQPQTASNGNVHGHLRPFSHPNAQHAIAASLPPVQTYGDQGYKPGVYDAGAGNGSHTDTSLSGRVILPKRH